MFKKKKVARIATAILLATGIAVSTITVVSIDKEPVEAAQIDLFAEGSYNLYSASNDGFSLEVTGNSASNKANIQVNTTGNGTGQQFYFDRVASDTYIIYTISSGKKMVLDIDASNVVQKTYTGAKSQRWEMNVENDGNFYITNESNGKALTFAGNKAKANATIATYNKSANQKFHIGSVGQLVKNGWYTISSKNASKMVVDIASNSTANKANAQIYSNNGSNAQKFYIKYLGKGEYSIGTGSTKGSSLLDVASANKANGANIHQYSNNGTDAQKWRIVKAYDGSYVFLSSINARSLNLSGGDKVPVNKTNIETWSYYGGGGQRFELKATSLDTGSSNSTAIKDTSTKVTNISTATGKYFHIRSSSKSSVGLNVRGTSFNNNMLIQSGNTDNNNRYRFRFVKDSDGYYTIIAANSEKALRATSTSVVQYNNDGSKDNKWIVYKNSSDNTYSFKSLSKGTYLSLPSIASGTATTVSKTNSSKNERFTLAETKYVQEVADGAYTFTSVASTSTALSVKGTSAANNANLYLDSKSSGAINQIIGLEYLGNGFYRLKTGSSIYKSCLYVAGGKGYYSGATVSQSYNRASNAEYWRILKTDKGYTFMSAGGNLVISANGSKAALANPSDTNTSQKFTLSKTSGTLTRDNRKYYFNSNGDRPLLGIDVSHHNSKIDWARAKKDGVDFAIIRAAYDYTLKDRYVDYNIAECERLGIPYGVYHYSMAVNNSEVDKETELLLSILKGKKPKLGVYIDIEDTREYEKKLGGSVYDKKNRQIITNLTIRLVNNVKKSGNKVGVYANKNYFDNVLYKDQLPAGTMWLARYSASIGISNPSSQYAIWQYSETGTVDGVPGNVDMNASLYQFY